MKDLLKKVSELDQSARDSLRSVFSVSDVLAFEAEYLSKKKGFLPLLKEIKNLSPEEKKEKGGQIQGVFRTLQTDFEKKKDEIEKKALEEKIKEDGIDVTQDFGLERGHLHPLSIVQRRIENIFTALGFEIADGPEIETEWNNFDALNIPESHPARDMQDTFWITQDLEKNLKNLVLRTQTSGVQVRKMQEHGVPIRIIAPGRVYRNEATDTTHDSTFYQVEGLVIDKDISLAHLKGTLENMLEQLFEKQIKIRFRPGFFPFVEPGLEVDIWFEYIDKQGNKQGKWLEFLGAGMVHPSVLKNCGINPDEYQGFAFGFGLTRLVMMKYGIDDIRLLFSQKKPFLSQF